MIFTQPQYFTFLLLLLPLSCPVFAQSNPTSEGYSLRQQIIPFTSETKVAPGLFYKIENVSNLLQLGIDGKLKPGDGVLQQRRVAEGGLWEFVPLPGGYFAIKNKLSGNYVGSPSARAVKAALVQDREVSDAASWRLQAMGEGQFHLINKASGMLLGSDGVTASHTPVLQLPETGEGVVWRLIVYNINPGVAIITTRHGEVVSGGNLSQLNAYNPQTGKLRFLLAKGIEYDEDGLIMSLLEASDGSIWVGLDKGLRQVDPIQGEILQNYLSYTHPAFLSNEVEALLEDADGTIWAGTYGGGLLHIFPKTREAVNFTNEEDYPGNFISAILPWKHEHLWVNTLNGPYYFDKKRKKFISSKPDIQLPGNSKQASAARHDAASQVDDSLDANSGAPQGGQTALMLTGFSFYDEKRDTLMEQIEGLQALRKVTLSPAVSWFRFNYAQLRDINPQGNHFKTWLEGFEKEWTYQGVMSFVRYNRLPAGSYTLHIRNADSSMDDADDELSVRIIVQQVFFKTWWFILLCCAVVGAAGFAILRYHYQQRLALERMRTRIASDLHDEVGSSLSHLNFVISAFDLENAPEQTAKGIEKSKYLMRKIASDIRDVVWAIDARRDKTGDLLDRMEDFAFDMFSAKEITYHFLREGIQREAKLNPFVRQNIYLIFKEAVNNITKHSNATEVHITLSQKSGTLEMTVADNGFSVNGSKVKGQGLDNMKLRAERIGGTMEAGQEEGGFVVRLLVG